MTAFVWIIGAIIVVWGMLTLVKPGFMRGTLVFLKKGWLVYISGVVKGVVGIVFLVYARSCNIPWLIITAGVLMAAGGFGIMFVDFRKIQGLMDWWLGRSDFMYRAWGLAAVIFGGLILYSGTPVNR